MTSSSPYPSMAKPSTTTVMKSPGGPKYHQRPEIRARWMYDSLTRTPQLLMTSGPDAGREDQYEDEDEWKPRYHQEKIRHPREEQVGNAAIESTNDPYRGPNDHRDDRRTKPDDEGDLSAIDKKSQDVEAFPVGTEPVSARWAQVGCRALQLGRIWADEERSPEGNQSEQDDDGEARTRQSVSYQHHSKFAEPLEVVQQPLAEKGILHSGAGGLGHLHASRTRGSRNMYKTSATALATTTPIVAIRKMPDRRGKSNAVVASHVSWPRPWMVKTISMTIAPLTTHPKYNAEAVTKGNRAFGKACLRSCWL